MKKTDKLQRPPNLKWLIWNVLSWWAIVSAAFGGALVLFPSLWPGLVRATGADNIALRNLVVGSIALPIIGGFAVIGILDRKIRRRVTGTIAKTMVIAVALFLSLQAPLPVVMAEEVEQISPQTPNGDGTKLTLIEGFIAICITGMAVGAVCVVFTQASHLTNSIPADTEPPLVWITVTNLIGTTNQIPGGFSVTNPPYIYTQVLTNAPPKKKGRRWSSLSEVHGTGSTRTDGDRTIFLTNVLWSSATTVSKDTLDPNDPNTAKEVFRYYYANGPSSGIPRVTFYGEGRFPAWFLSSSRSLGSDSMEGYNFQVWKSSAGMTLRLNDGQGEWVFDTYLRPEYGPGTITCKGEHPWGFWVDPVGEKYHGILR
jgi:hypothetical protein